MVLGRWTWGAMPFAGAGLWIRTKKMGFANLQPTPTNPESEDVFLSGFGVEGFSFSTGQKIKPIAGSHRSKIISDGKIKGRKVKLSGPVTPADYWTTIQDYFSRFAQGDYNLYDATENTDANGAVEDMQYIGLVANGATQDNYGVDSDGTYVYHTYQNGTTGVISKTLISDNTQVAVNTTVSTTLKDCAYNAADNTLYVLNQTTAAVEKWWMGDSSSNMILIQSKSIDTILLEGNSGYSDTIDDLRYCDVDDTFLFITCRDSVTNTNYVIKIAIADLTYAQHKTKSNIFEGICIINSDLVATVRPGSPTYTSVVHIIKYSNLDRLKSVSGLLVDTPEGMCSNGQYIWISGIFDDIVRRFKKDFSDTPSGTLLDPASPNQFTSPRGIAVHGNEIYVVNNNVAKGIQRHFRDKYSLAKEAYMRINEVKDVTEKYYEANNLSNSKLTVEFFAQRPFWLDTKDTYNFFDIGNTSEYIDLTTTCFIASPIFVFYFDTVNVPVDITVTHIASGRTFTITPTLNSSVIAQHDIITVNCENGKVKQNGENIIGDMVGNFFELDKGLNFFKVSSSTGTWDGMLQICYQGMNP